jgi:hypothetical protein
MIAFRLLAAQNWTLYVAAIGAMTFAVIAGPTAQAASPPEDGWQASSGNPIRNGAAAAWAPTRNQLREIEPRQTSSNSNSKAAQAVIVDSNVTPTAAPAKAEQHWTLPNQAKAESRTAASSNSNTAAVHEPREFVPAANVQPLPPAGAKREQSPIVATRPATASRVTDRRIEPSQAAYPSHGRSPIASAHRANAGRRPAPKMGMYTGGFWDTINVAFQGPEQLMEGELQPETLPLPGGPHEMEMMHGPEHMHGPYDIGMEGCADGSCPSYGGCGDGMCGCADGYGCGEMCEPGCGCEPSCGCGSESCGNGCVCDGMCLGFGDHESCHTIRVRVPKWQELVIFGGVHGFKGPYDQDRDGGNFGFHEGLNAGFKVPYTPMGYQLGYQAVHSQLNGDENTDDPNSHTQHFVTAGIFQRARDGLQGGVAWDMLRDERFNSIDFHQLRGELSFIDRGCHELGVAAAIHLNDNEVFAQDGSSTLFQATDQYLLFYRFHGARGGEGRFYGGWNDDSDGIVGADMLLPLSDRWSLAAAFTYLIPEEGSGEIGAGQEAWNVSTGLVWHWDCRARRSHSNCYRPLFNVADNGYLIIDDRPGAPAQNGGM